MFHPFISSQHFDLHGSGGAIVSVVTHAALIATAVAVTATPRLHTLSAGDVVTQEHVQFVVSANYAESDAPVKRESAPVIARRAVARPPAPDVSKVLPLPAISMAGVAPALPVELDYGTMASGNIAFATTTGEKIVRGVLGRAFEILKAGGVFTADVVERIASPRQGPKPRYPGSLQAMHVEDSFVVRFVVDSTGKVEENTFEFPPNAHPLFVKSVREALIHTQYWPAELDGQRVPELVEQRFTFRMDDSN